METRCLECKFFDVWDGDPVCLHPTVWQVTLPDAIEDCKKHEPEPFEGNVTSNKEEWEAAAPDFFKRYYIDKSLAEAYLKHHPEHADIIDILGG